MSGERLIGLDLIRIDGDTQPRAAIQEPAVAEYAEEMKAEEKPAFPAVTVYFDGREYWLADGFHRWHAARRNDPNGKILANVVRGTCEEARWFACGANRMHGLRRTQSDKRRAILLALRNPRSKGLSDREIARHVGVSHETVAEVRKVHLAKSPDITPTVASTSSEKRTVSRGGQTYKMDTSNLTKKPAAPEAPPVPNSDPDDVPMDDDEAQDEDQVGQKIPAALRPDFARRDEITRMMTTVSDLKTAVMKAHADKDPLFKDLNPSQWKAECENLYRTLRALRPHAVCPYCNGRGCRACLSRGWIGEFVYEAVPQETKKR